MGHLHDRLGERVPPRVAETAHTLLREPRVLAHWLHLLSKRLPELATAPRVALPLLPGEAPPVLLVERTGHGVTCLGAGMACDAPRVPAQLVADLCEHLERRFRRRVLNQKVAADPELDGTLARALTHPQKLTLHQFRQVQTLAPLLETDMRERLMAILDALDRASYEPARLRHMTDEEAAGFWRAYLGACFGMMAVPPAGMGFSLAKLAALGPDVMLAARGLWLLVNQPERTLAWVEDSLRSETAGFAQLALPWVAVIGIRFSRWRQACLELGRAMGVKSADLPGRALTLDAARLLALQRLAFFTPLLAKASGATGEELVRLKAACQATQEALKAGKDFKEVLRLAPAVVGRGVAHLDLEREWDAPASLVLPAGEPTPAARMRAVLWQRVVEFQPLPICLAAMVEQVTLSAAPLSAWVPLPEVADWMSVPSGMHHLRDWLPTVMRLQRPQTVVNAEPRVSRNARCPCGSGNKFKKCCGAA